MFRKVFCSCLMFVPLVSARTNYVQGSSATPQTAVTSVLVRFSKPQRPGDTNVVIVGWKDATATVSSVTDTRGNRYALAVGPTVANGLSQAIYYSAGIKPGANKVTVKFSSAAAFEPDIRILEYSGIATSSPIDRASAGSGYTATSSSGLIETTNATDLLVAGNIVSAPTVMPGWGFRKRLITPNGNIAEDWATTGARRYVAYGPMARAGYWIMQVVAFRAAGSVQLKPATVTSVSPNIGLSSGGTFVTITGTNFAAGATVSFGGAAATNVRVTSGTSIRARTPSGRGSVSVAVKNPGATAGARANAYLYTAPPQHSVALKWVHSATSNVTYNIYRQTGSARKVRIAIGLPGTSYVDANVTAGATYTYTATAEDAAGFESATSRETTVTIPSP